MEIVLIVLDLVEDLHKPRIGQFAITMLSNRAGAHLVYRMILFERKMQLSRPVLRVGFLGEIYQRLHIL